MPRDIKGDGDISITSSGAGGAKPNVAAAKSTAKHAAAAK